MYVTIEETNCIRAVSVIAYSGSVSWTIIIMLSIHEL